MKLSSLKFAGTLALAVSIIAAGADAGTLKLKKSKPRIGGFVSSAGTNGGTGTQLPDLRVEPMTNSTIGMPNTGVCGAWSNGGYTNVKMRVRNVGNAPAEISSLNLILQKGGQYAGGAVIQVAGLAAGQSKIVSFPVPAAAQPGLHDSFTVKAKADSPNYIPELSEGNNNLTAHCLGPAG